jgi:hypothetical protein
VGRGSWDVKLATKLAIKAVTGLSVVAGWREVAAVLGSWAV